MGCDQNLRELSVNKILRFTVSGNREIRERQFSLSMAIVFEKLANFCVISLEIAIIMGIGHELGFAF